MTFTRSIRSQFVTANLLVLFACIFWGGCKRSVSASQNAQTSVPGGASNGDQPGSLADRLKAVQDQAAQSSATNAQGGASNSILQKAAAGPPPPLPDWKPVSTATAIEIPLIKGLVVNSTISSTDGDLEDIETIKEINANTITKDGDNEHAPKTPGGHPPDLNAPPEITGKGTIILDVADVASSSRLFPYFATGQTMHHPGTLDRGVSTDTLKQLRSGKLVDLQVATDMNTLLSATMKGHLPPTITPWGTIPMYQCDLQRVEPQDVAFPVLVNNEPVELPVIHAKCVLDNKDETTSTSSISFPIPSFSIPGLAHTETAARPSRSRSKPPPRRAA